MPLATNRLSGNVFFRCVEDSNDAIMLTDAAGILTYVNPAWSQIYGFSKGEAVGKTPGILHSGQQNPDFYKAMWARIRNPKYGNWKGELVNKTKEGVLVPVLLTITPFLSETGEEISGYMGIASDLSYHRELEAKVAHQDRLASIGLLASGLAHEIGTPMGVIRGRAEFLMMKSPDPTFKKGLGIIISEIDRITKIIRSLLRISRSFSDVRLETIKVLEPLNEVLTLVGQTLRNDQIDVQVSSPEDLLIRADFGRLEQIFLNLVMNSIHAIRKAQEGGRKGSHFLRFETQKKADLITLEMTDSGCGISPENLNNIFKPFYTTKDVGEGTGLGLAIVAQLIREMEGKISVRSELDKGTTFSLTLTEGT